MQHHAKKRFGQNFLVDNNVIDKIIHSINPQPDDHLIEIGPGLGALTQPLLHTVTRLDVIELDRDVIPELKNLDGSERLHIHNIDVLSFDFTSFTEANFQQEKLRIIGNLPYNISTAVLFHLVKHRSIIRDLHFMLQKEVVERIAASVGSHDYGRLSVMMQLYFNISPLFTVSPQCFRPVPRVESAIIRLQPGTDCPVSAAEHADFESLIKQAFSQRRKTLRNTLKNTCSVAQLEAAGIDPGKRPQELGVNDYITLFRQLQ
ncbi:MAG: 16S rRNA (adenine(1518)-N(6)/adenine(1519)-N(6))-dimethyltransferase RsmA [Gammaproteobacteria bacterium]|jgi:16S rRNA (adenine1518-N6/adenine1519-N6)-dimethyltransferase